MPKLTDSAPSGANPTLSLKSSQIQSLIGWLLLAVLLLSLAFARVKAGERSTGYAQHVDDRHLLGNAKQIISTGNWDPEFFKYPSLPIYLTTLSFYAGDAAGAGGGFKSERSPFRVDYGKGWPFEPRALYLFPRLLFALLGGCTIVAGAVTALMSVPQRRRGALVVAGAALSALALSYLPVLQHLNVSYLNVDTPAAFFTTCTLAVIFAFWESESLLKRAVLPGVLVGLATASKYNSGLILVPCLLALIFGSMPKKWLFLLILGASFVATFLATVPYSVLNSETFVKDVLFEMNHYREGHPGQETEPGLTQLLYYAEALLKQLGDAWVSLAALGSVWLLVTDWRRGLTLLAFPVLMLAHMSMNRVHFLRTVVPAFCVIALLVGVGAVALGELAHQALRRWVPQNAFVSLGCVALASAVFFLSAPDKLAASLFDRNIQADSRTELLDWLKQQGDSPNIWITGDICLSNEFRQESKTKSLGVELKKLKKVASSAAPGSLLVVPHYGTTRPPPHIRRDKKAKKKFIKKQKSRAKALNLLVSKKLGGEDFLLVSEFAGRKVGLNQRRGRRAACVSSPALKIYERRATGDD